jgi:uncharacterized membrane protein YdbT with pleckstrin-like domain
VSGATEQATAWVYRGLWGVLVQYLRVPKGPPGVPPGAGEVLRSIKPAIGFLKYLKFQFWILLVAIDVCIITLWVVILVANPLVGLLTAPIFWGVAIIPDVIAFAAIHVRYDTTWYLVTERGVRIRRGVWLLRENTITFENVQNVEVKQGPVQRYFGISDLVIQTAGGGGAAGPHGQQGASSHHGLLEGINDAAALRDLIMEKALASRGAGLGDERGETREGVGLSRTDIQVLGEIRDALTPSAPTG